MLQSTEININVMAEIVAQTGATMDAFETIFYKEESHEKTMVDIGVLRFPDPLTPLLPNEPFCRTAVTHFRFVWWLIITRPSALPH